ncbi:MAG: putative peptide maturation dehydrogenase [Chiayiivirga sp.]|jgi:putative peptide maturation dehydrogenase|uniref:putative peptide maturation dehydrogenase n=1 Tax=Chiayiivirga sp. TaxID=2041042 RepID=UPI0025BF4EB4|nr:putative peptide maturation dehydrogenase [Chiayiivirga sp.]MCI1711365.1 putative peptide maturation dehydrogenase [Chiayiivirga sp.]MCI1727832.1 putative peptide maturation dehydrogenase [Chiayiivirga sp.]
MLLRRCSALLIQPREQREFDLDSLLRGGDGTATRLQWIALAPHLEHELVLDAPDVLLLGDVSETRWVDRTALAEAHGAQRVDALLARGLLIGDDATHAAMRERDERQREAHWHPLAAALQTFGRWRDVDSSDALTQTGLRTLGDLVRQLGPPPPHVQVRGTADTRVSLPRPSTSALEALMQRRTTCRNFDRASTLPLADCAALMHRVFAAQAVIEPAPGAAIMKKTSPSGGGLHATEAYLLVQRVEGIEPGLYHYHAVDHALQPLPCAAPDEESLRALARRCVAGQHWFGDAHVLVMLVPRFARSFWKYRNHAKAYRALILDVGHLSQTLYLGATELGLGAFVTAAINEVEIEQAFGLDPQAESPLAVCGFGSRGAEKATVEFDPLGQVWPR